MVEELKSKYYQLGIIFYLKTERFGPKKSKIITKKISNMKVLLINSIDKHYNQYLLQ